MIPAVTDTPQDRENLSVVGRICASIGSAVIQVGTLLTVLLLGAGNERAGFGRLALIVAFVFFVKKFTLTDARVQQIADTLKVGKEEPDV